MPHSMTEVFTILDHARRHTAELHDSLATRHRLAAGEAPVGAFNMVNQFVVVAMELVSHYADIWSGIPAADVDQGRRQEWAERLITITKSTFILSMSAMEFSAKEALLARPRRVPLPRGRVYLGGIMKKSLTAGLITAADEEAWKGLVQVRNLLVHNNGIADGDATFALPNGPTITLVAGAMTKASLEFFPQITLVTISAYARWSDAFLA